MKARTAHIDGLNGRESLQHKAALYGQLLITNGKLGHEIGHVLHPFATMSPEEILGTFRPASLEDIFRSGSLTIDAAKIEELLQDISGLRSLTFGIEKPDKEPVQPPTKTEDVIEAYLTRMEDAGAANGYLSVRARKLRFFARQHPELPTDPGVIRAYLRQFRTDNVPTRLDQWKAVSALYKFASDTYDLPNPMLKVDKPRFRKKSGQRLSRDQAKTFLSVVETDLEWALVTCYFGLRFRRIEAERLRSCDIKPDYLIVQGKERTEELPLLPFFHDRLLRLQSDHPSDRLFPIKADAMAYHIRRIFKRAGITGVRASPHTLRNTAGALWSTFGGDWTSNRQLLRHSEKTMTDHYSPLSIDELRVKDERHNPMLNLLRELAPETLTNTTGVRETEAASQIRDTISTYQATTDPAQLPELLDQMILLGQRAQELRHSLGGNGHWPQELKEVMQYLEHRAGK